MSVRQTSNLRSEIRPALFALADALNFRRRLRGGRRLGDELLDTAGLEISRRTIEEQTDPQGQPLAALNEEYRRRKVRKGFSGKILVRTGKMTDPLQVSGQHTVTTSTATMEAGLDEETKQKVEYAEEGSDNRPERHFYDLDAAGRKTIDDFLGGVIDQRITELGG